jgi:hypothetical protein
MGEVLSGIFAGIIVSLINKFLVNGSLWTMCNERQVTEDDDGVSSQSSAIISDIHVQH